MTAKKIQWTVQKLVEKRIVDIDYLFHMHWIDRDPLTQADVVKLENESSELKIWLAQNGVKECPAM